MTFGKDFFQQRATCLLLFQFCKKTWMLMQSGASDNGIVLFLCAIAYHIRGNDLVREEPSLPDHFWAKVRPGRTSGPERTVPSGPPFPSDQGEKNILAENCHLAKICVYNIVPIKNFGTANNKDRCSLSKEDKELLQMHLLPPYEMGTHLT